MLYERPPHFNFSPRHTCMCARVDTKTREWIARCNKAYPILYGIWFRCHDERVKAQLGDFLAHFMAYIVDQRNTARLSEPVDTRHGHVTLLNQLFPHVRVVLIEEPTDGPRWVYSQDGAVSAAQ